MSHSAFVIAAALALGACAAPGAAELAASATAHGHHVAKRACAACHAVEPGGESPRAAAPAFTSLEMRHTAGLEGRVADLTRLGHYDMPPVRLRPEDVRALTAYIESLSGR